MLQQFKWELNGLQHELRPTPEGNLWQVIATQADGKEKAVGYMSLCILCMLTTCCRLGRMMLSGPCCRASLKSGNARSRSSWATKVNEVLRL